MKDLYTLPYLTEILKAGAFSLKIEGRMKSALYTATVVSIYRKYLDIAKKGQNYTVSEEDEALLKEVYDRGGYTSYLRNHNGKTMVNLENRPFRAENKERSEQLKKDMEGRVRKLPLSMELTVEAGKVLRLLLQFGEQVSVEVFSEEKMEKAKERATSEEELEKQLKKTGNTDFYVERVLIRNRGDVFVPLSVVNALRREGIEKVREAILAGFRRDKRDRDYSSIH
jgi:hypothetical protein